MKHEIQIFERKIGYHKTTTIFYDNKNKENNQIKSRLNIRLTSLSSASECMKSAITSNLSVDFNHITKLTFDFLGN